MKKKVLHLNKNSEYSGAENVAMNICILAKKYNQLYASPRGQINTILESNSVKHYDLKKFNFKSIEEIIILYKPDIIHAHDVTASIIAALISLKYKNIKIISHLHNNDPKMRKPSFRWVAYSLCIPLFYKIIVVSDSVKSEYFGNLIDKGIELPNIVNLQVSPVGMKKEKKKFDIITIARLVPQKRPELFLELIGLIKLKIPDIKVAYIGDGNLKEQFLRDIEKNNLQENITFFGFQSNPYKYLDTSKVFVLTSAFEGFGLVALEALAFGLPAVVTHVGGLPNIVNNSVGISSNDIKIMSEEILELLKNEKYYQRKSKHARERYTELNNIKKFIKTLEAIYN